MLGGGDGGFAPFVQKRMPLSEVIGPSPPEAVGTICGNPFVHRQAAIGGSLKPVARYLSESRSLDGKPSPITIPHNESLIETDAGAGSGLLSTHLLLGFVGPVLVLPKEKHLRRYRSP